MERNGEENSKCDKGASIQATRNCRRNMLHIRLKKPSPSKTVNGQPAERPIEEAIYFNISHEGVHLGSVLALKCAINAMKNE